MEMIDPEGALSLVNDVSNFNNPARNFVRDAVVCEHPRAVHRTCAHPYLSELDFGWWRIHVKVNARYEEAVSGLAP
jgi:hypothetical protein